MKKTQLEKSSVEDLTKQLIEAQEGYLKIKREHGLGELKNTSSIKKAKKAIAVLNTLLKKKSV